MNLNAVLIFVKVVEFGSFTKAAKELHLSSSTVSDRIIDLERELGIRLLTRTTRKLHLTEPGKDFFEKAEVAVRSLLVAQEEASTFQKRPMGTLKITAPADLDPSFLCEAVLQYRKKFPNVKVEMHFTDRLVDFAGEGIDIAIRVGNPKEQNLTAKLLGDGALILAASPEYIKKSSKIMQPKDLSQHQCISYLPEGQANEHVSWQLVSSHGKKISVKVNSGCFSNSFNAILKMVIAGQGVALVPPVMIINELSKKHIIRILPDWTNGPMPIHLVYPSHRASSAKVREMIPILEPCIRKIITKA